MNQWLDQSETVLGVEVQPLLYHLLRHRPRKDKAHDNKLQPPHPNTEPVQTKGEVRGLVELGAMETFVKTHSTHLVHVPLVQERRTITARVILAQR